MDTRTSSPLSRRRFLRFAGSMGVSLLLAACAAQQPKEVEKQVTKEVEKEVTKVVERVVTPTLAPRGKVNLLMWYYAANHDPFYKPRIAQIEEKLNLKITMELMSLDVEWKKLQATLMAGNGYPDIFESSAERIARVMKGKDKDIPFLALNEALNNSPYMKQVWPVAWSRLTSSEGLIYATPNSAQHAMVMLYNDEAWQKIGVDLSKVQTWDAYIDACSKIDKKMPDGRPRYAMMDTLGGNAGLSARMIQKDVWWTNKQGDLQFTNPAFKEAVVDYMRTKPFWVNWDWANHVAMLKEGQFMSVCCPDFLYGMHKQGVAGDQAFMAKSPMRVMPLPSFKAEGPHTGAGWGGTGACVTKQSTQKDLAQKALFDLYFENGKGELEERFKLTGIMPPLEPAWDGKTFHEADAYVGGQKPAELYVAAIRALPAFYENWTTGLCQQAWGEQFPLLWEGKLTVEEAIVKAGQAAQDLIKANA